jgi:hypothetical protein
MAARRKIPAPLDFPGKMCYTMCINHNRRLKMKIVILDGFAVSQTVRIPYTKKDTPDRRV